jgi:hypothetical protein
VTEVALNSTAVYVVAVIFVATLKLTSEQRETAAECDAGDLTFRSTFAKHENQ